MLLLRWSAWTSVVLDGSPYRCTEAGGNGASEGRTEDVDVYCRCGGASGLLSGPGSGGRREGSAGVREGLAE